MITPKVHVIKRGQITKTWQFETLEDLKTILDKEWSKADGKLNIDDEFGAECIRGIKNARFLNDAINITESYNDKIKQAKRDRGEVVGLEEGEALKIITEEVVKAREAFDRGEFDKYLIKPPFGTEQEILENVKSQVIEDFEEEIGNVDLEIELGLKKYTYGYIIKENGLDQKGIYVTVWKDIHELRDQKRLDEEARGVRAYTDEEIEELINNKDFIKTLENGVVLELAY